MTQLDSARSLPTHLVDLVRRHAVDVAIDVGANEGQWASTLRAAGFTGPLFSFEPASGPFAVLSRAAEGDPDWSVERIALGRRDGVLRLRQTRHSVFTSALKLSPYARSLFRDGVAVVGEEEVPLRRLDGVIPRLPGYRPSWRLLVKIDVQGLDLEVFEGARGVLEQIQLLQAECSARPLYDGAPDWLEALAAYRRAGYVPAGFFPVVRTEPYATWCEFDCVLSRHGRIPAPEAETDRPPVSAIVTACADSEPLRALLADLRGPVDALRGEIVLVINAGENALAASHRLALEKRCDQLLFEPRVGKSYALNAAVAASRGAVLAFTEDDAKPGAGWLATLTAPLLADDRPATLVGTGGRVEPLFPDATPDWFREMVLEKDTHFLGPRHDLGPTTRAYDLQLSDEAPLGANCAFRREVFAVYHYDPALGPNRASGLRGGEDFLLGRLLLRDGYTIQYVPDARVTHSVHRERMTPADVVRSHYLQGIESVRIAVALGDSRQLRPAKARRKLRKCRLKLLRHWLKSGFRLPKAKRIALRAQIALRRGKLRELIRPGGPA